MCEFRTGAPVAILPLIKNFTTLPKLTRNWTMNLSIRLKLISWITHCNWIAIIQSFSWLLLSRILDFATTFFKIKIRGTMYINLEKQTLNQQWGLSLSFSLFLVHCIFQIDILLIFVFVQCFLFSWFMSKYHYCCPVL